MDVQHHKIEEKATLPVNAGKERIQFSQLLRGENDVDIKEQEDRLAIGGLRNPHVSIRKLPLVASFGISLGEKLSSLIEANPEWMSSTLKLIGQDTSTAPRDASEAVRHTISEACGKPNLVPVNHPTCSTPIRAHLLEAWRKASQDPDEEVYKWFVQGAPVGIYMPVEACGIFPTISDEDKEDHDELRCDIDDFVNYPGVEQDDTVEIETVKHLQAGRLAAYYHIAEVRQALNGDEPILNKIGIITRERGGVIKKRMILDTTQSRIKEATAKGQRVFLPRLFDAVYCTLQHMNLADSDPHNEIEHLVLDFRDAFWQILLNAAERKFFCTNLSIGEGVCVVG